MEEGSIRDCNVEDKVTSKAEPLKTHKANCIRKMKIKIE